MDTVEPSVDQPRGRARVARAASRGELVEGSGLGLLMQPPAFLDAAPQKGNESADTQQQDCSGGQCNGKRQRPAVHKFAPER